MQVRWPTEGGDAADAPGVWAWGTIATSAVGQVTAAAGGSAGPGGRGRGRTGRRRAALRALLRVRPPPFFMAAAVGDAPTTAAPCLPPPHGRPGDGFHGAVAVSGRVSGGTGEEHDPGNGGRPKALDPLPRRPGWDRRRGSREAGARARGLAGHPATWKASPGQQSALHIIAKGGGGGGGGDPTATPRPPHRRLGGGGGGTGGPTNMRHLSVCLPVCLASTMAVHFKEKIVALIVPAATVL